MKRAWTLGARQLVVVGLIVGTVVLAVPTVANWVGRALYGERATPNSPPRSSSSGESHRAARAKSGADQVSRRVERTTESDSAAPTMARSYDRPEFGKTRSPTRVATTWTDRATQADHAKRPNPRPQTKAMRSATPRTHDAPGDDSQVRRASATATTETSASPNKKDRIAHVRAELKRLGASYFVVERNSDAQAAAAEAYECRCVAPIGADSSYSRAFSAVGPSPIAAAESILTQVRQWRTERASRRAN